jgi:rubredoxin
MTIAAEDELAALRERVVQLEAQLGELRASIERSAAGGFRSIRDSRRCPACGNQTFLHVPSATQLTDSGAVPLGLHHVLKWRGPVVTGVMESFTCRACGLVELHVIDAREVEIDGKTVRAVDGDGEPPSDGPFR